MTKKLKIKKEVCQFASIMSKKNSIKQPQLQTFSWHCVRENSKTRTWRRFGKNLFQLTLQLNSPKPRRKREVYPISFVYIWTIIEVIVLDLCGPLQEFNFFSSLRRAEKQFWHRQGHQRPRSLIGSTNVVIQKTITAVSRVEFQKRVNLEKTWTGISGFQMQSKENFINAWEESWKTHKKGSTFICIEKTHQPSI